MLNQAKSKKVLLILRLDLMGIIRLPQILRAAGCHVTLFAPPGVAVSQSRYVDQHIAAPPSNAELIGQLKQHLSEHLQEYCWIIIADETLLQDLARYKGEAWLEGWFPVDHRSRAIESITSKFTFLQASADAGLPVPKFQICAGFPEAQKLAGEYGFPLMLKQPTSMSGSGVRKVWGMEDFAPQFAAISCGQPVMVQQCISGVRGQTEVLFDHGQPICWESSQTLISWPTELAASCVRQEMDHPSIEPLLAGIGALTGFHGLGGVDWVIDETTGELSLIEFNARPTPGWYSNKKLSAAMAAMLHGHAHLLMDGPATNKEVSAQTIYMFPQCVFRAVDDRNLMLLLRAGTNLPWRDPLLLLALLRRIASHYVPVGLRQWARTLAHSGSALLVLCEW